ncbi:MAG: hypothetical protein EZS28_029885 [Streblomastix strix]|uniref:Uncharacterized protein n=1 Tax=Streblomastix strix TaxID=222440 RepID=A0A5J4UVW6_9EUKA|nr:MAG: hypothetical protein EZS28_029885 [Streblomastix strix]
MLKGYDLTPVGKDDEGQYWPGFGPGQSMSQKTSRRHYNQPKQHGRNLEIDSEDLEICPYHRATRNQDMTLLTEEVSQENGQDQEAIRDREIIKVQEKLEWKSIGIKIDLKPGTNQEVEAGEHIDEGNIVIKEGDKTITIETNRTRGDIEKHRNITHIQNRPLTRQRTLQTGTGHTNLRIGIEEKAEMTIEMMIGQNAHKCGKTQQRIIAIVTQPGLKMKSCNTMQHHHNPNNLHNKHKECNRYRQNLNNKLQPKYQKRKGEKINYRIQTTLTNKKVIQEKLAAFQKEKEQYGISDLENDWQQLIGAIDSNNNLTPRSAQKQLQEMTLQSVSNQTTQQQQQTIGSIIQQRIISPLPRMISTGMNKDKPVAQSQLSVTPTQKSQHRSGIRQRLKQAERELQELKAKQLLQQQENNDLNNINVDISDIQGTVGYLTGLQLSSGAQSPGLNAGLRLKETGSLSASNRERTEPQIIEGQQDNAEEEEDEQTDEVAFIQNKDHRVNIISQPSLNGNDDSGFAPVEVQEKPKQGKGSKKSKTESLSASNEPSQSSNTQAQTETASKVPKPKVKVSRSIASDRAGTLQSREISIEVSLRNREEERADDDSSSGDGVKDWRIDKQRERQKNGGQDQKIHINMETVWQGRLHKYQIASEIQRLKQLIEIRREYNDNSIQRNKKREGTLPRIVERWI